MIYEIAQLPVRKEHIETFRQVFAEVVALLERAKGYRSHVLAQGIETPELFHLIVRWRSLEDHTPGFETVRRRMIWNLRPAFGAESLGSSGLGYAA